MTPNPEFIERMNKITANCKAMVEKDKYQPAVIKAIAEYGAENIYMVGNSYHGKYEDDYASFTYYNNITGEYFTDGWTTAAACPAYSLYEHIYIDEAWKNGVVNAEKLYKVVLENRLNSIKNFKFDLRYTCKFEDLVELGLRVNVTGGRKWKGVGFLVGIYQKSYQWDIKLWRSDNDYGTSTTRYAKILDPVTGNIYSVTAGYVKFIDMDKFVEEYKNVMIERLNNTTVENLTVGNNKFNYSPVSGDNHSVACGIEYNNESFIEWLKKNHSNKFDLSIYHDIEQEKIDAKNVAFKESKMPELIEWVKNNTDKTGDEITKLAEHIYNKRYA